MKTSTTTIAGLLGLTLLTTVAAPMQSARAGHLDQVGLIEKTWDGVAIKGYDPVAYFMLGAALRGSEEFAIEWLGQKWHFKNAQHRDLFKADPIKYVPQYGGYCSESHDVTDINPTAFRIVDGRLYIFYAEESAAKFETDKYAQSEAEAYWHRVRDGLAQ